ncbi:MAG: hypothetical protein AAFV93_17890, partial [Chloroflexota bacterium]
MSYSAIQDKVLMHLHTEKELPHQVDGVTVRSSTIAALQRRGAINGQYQLTEDVGLARVQSVLAE